MFDFLPEHLAERIRIVGDNVGISDSGPVVVWLKSSHRFHENPAIDVGRTIANEMGLPLLIYHGIDERYPWASLRHHNSLLDAAVDVSRLCKKHGISHFLHVAREGHRPSVMKEFAKTASIIVTDLFPIPPWDKWVKSISKISQCPVIEVDCHCVIPMPLYGKSVDRPFKFRSATKKMRKQRLQKSWPKVTTTPQKYTGYLPFTPVDIESEIVNMEARFELLKQCDIDPTILPIWTEKGGEVFAMNKWQKFLDLGISGYARRRNNAADPNGVSRLSYAFHYGFLSPMKVAREAAAIGTKSAEKYLDELLIFREHAWHHVYASSEPYSAVNLPGWAIGSWRRTEDDTRTIVPEHKLEFAQSPSDLWNECQRSLTRHGELHNNLRMTWGKAFPVWTTSLEKSLEIGQKLNDKYALDGRDPSSIVGVQWCHGLFDRPFEPSIPVMGIVRKRDIETHKSRLDFIGYKNHVSRKNGDSDRVYIIKGNPIFRSLAARIIEDNGYEVVIAKSSSQSTIHKVSRLDLNPLPNWLSDSFNTILKHSNEGEPSELISNLESNISQISMNNSSAFTHADLISLLGKNLTETRIAVIESDHKPKVELIELEKGMEIQDMQSDDEEFSAKVKFSLLKTQIWNLIEIIWKDNSNPNLEGFSIQHTLM